MHRKLYISRYMVKSNPFMIIDGQQVYQRPYLEVCINERFYKKELSLILIKPINQSQNHIRAFFE